MPVVVLKKTPVPLSPSRLLRREHEHQLHGLNPPVLAVGPNGSRLSHVPDRCGMATFLVRKLAQFERQEAYPFDASLVATNLTTTSARSFPLSEPETLGVSQFDIELMRHIDGICRRFEADWRAGACSPF